MSEWARVWGERVQAALAPVAQIALGEHGQEALKEVRADFDKRLAKAGLAA